MEPATSTPRHWHEVIPLIKTTVSSLNDIFSCTSKRISTLSGTLLDPEPYHQKLQIEEQLATTEEIISSVETCIKPIKLYLCKLKCRRDEIKHNLKNAESGKEDLDSENNDEDDNGVDGIDGGDLDNDNENDNDNGNDDDCGDANGEDVDNDNDDDYMTITKM